MERQTALCRILYAALESYQGIAFAFLHEPLADSERPRDDIDVAIYLHPAWASEQAPMYEMALSIELTQLLRIPVNVHVLNGASLQFQHSVLHQGQIFLSRDDEILTDFIERVTLTHIECSNYIREYLYQATS